MSENREEIFGQLQKGEISAGEFLDKIHRAKALKEAPKENPAKLKNERAQGFSDLWFSQRTIATIEQKDKVGLSYISKFLGLGDEAAEQFAQGDDDVYHTVGTMNAAIPVRDTTEFWKEIQRLFPDVYTDEDIEFLITRGGLLGVIHFLGQLEVPCAEESRVLRLLAENVAAYK